MIMNSMEKKSYSLGKWTRPNSVVVQESIEPLSFSKIYDDGYMHALRLYQDQDSKGIRIQASALSGELKRLLSSRTTPFYTHCEQTDT